MNGLMHSLFGALGLPEAFHFAQPDWFWALLLLPMLLLLRGVLGRRMQRRQDNARYRDYADPQLLPYLVRGQQPDGHGRGSIERSWQWVTALVWLLMITALAGPRWEYREISMQDHSASLLVLMDISRSMDVMDVLPSRLSVARLRVEDLINLNAQQQRGVRVGLVAFASVAQVVVPITDDVRALRQVLPYINTQLSSLGGSRVLTALDMAQRLFEGERRGTGKTPAASMEGRQHVLLVTDGDFAEPELNARVKALADMGILVHVLAVGTEQGGPVMLSPRGPDGSVQPGAARQYMMGPDGRPVISALPSRPLQSLAVDGQGHYLTHRASDTELASLLDEVAGSGLERMGRSDSAAEMAADRQRIWDEVYFWFVAMVLLLLLPWYRRRGGMK